MGTSREDLEKLMDEYPYQVFRLLIENQLIGSLNRNAFLGGRTVEQSQKPIETVYPDATIREAVSKMIDKSASLLVVISQSDATPIGIVTLHDIIRLQSQLADAN